MTDEWDLGPVAELPEEGPCLKKAPNGERLACIRHKDGTVNVIADACPHEGYPLSQGVMREGVLTCKWHNWKFEVASGSCLFGGEAVRRYPARVDADGNLRVDGALDAAAERARITASLRAGLVDSDVARCTRDALRLAKVAGEQGLTASFEIILGDALARGRYGFSHAAASAIDVWTWALRGWLPTEQALVAALTLVTEPLQFLPMRAHPEPISSAWEDARDVCELLATEQREEAEGRARFLGAIDPERAIKSGIVPFVRRALYDYGHGAIYTGKALEIARAFPALGADATGALTAMLSWATSETALPTWSATREAIARCTMIDRAGTSPLDAQARATYEAQVLTGEREAVQATLELMARGADVAGVLRAIGHAAAVRLGRFDLSWTRRADTTIDYLDVTHAVTCARAMQELWSLDPRAENAPLALVCASFVGKLRKADDPNVPPPDAFVGDARAARIVDAVRAREPARARAMVARIDRATRLEAYRGLAPFAAFEAAVRPILLSHTVKTTEALYRMEIDDPREASGYLDALVRYLATPVPERAFARTASIAQNFLRDGRPPEGLY